MADPMFKYRLLATFSGVILAFALARLAEWAKAEKDKKKKRRALALGFRRTLDHNLGLLNQVLNEFRAGRIPTFPMDVGFFDYSSPHVFELIGDANDASAFEHARYELRHFDIKLEMLRVAAGAPDTGQFRQELRKSVSDHLPLVERAIRLAVEAAKKYENS